MPNKKRRLVFMALLCMTVLLMLAMRDGGGTDDGDDDDEAAEDTDEDFRARLRGPLEFSDAGLLSVVRERYLTPPSDLPYALQRERRDSNAVAYNNYIAMDPAYLPLQRLLLKVFEGVRDGFFVEAGAVDGEFLSNTLVLELRQGWTGLLVEPDGDMYRNLLQRHRRAWASHSCLSPRPYAYREILIKYSANSDTEPGVSMYARGHGVLSSHEDVSPGMVVNGDSGVDQPLYEWVQCLPLASLLLALNTSHVHLVSLDVEGAETHILRSFPWHRITVDVWLVEHVTAHATRNDHPTGRTSDDRNRATHNRNSTHTNGDTVHNSSNNNDTTTTTAPQRQQQQRRRHDLLREGRDVEFVDFFSSKGYVLYPSDTASLLDNYLFIRRNSSVYRAEFDETGQSRNVVLKR